jgi:hypothetical protein
MLACEQYCEQAGVAWLLILGSAKRESRLMFVVCGTQHWRAELPLGWCAQHGRGNVALYDPEGVGALQFSSFRKPHAEVLVSDLEQMANGVPKDANGLQPVQVGEFCGLRCEATDGGRYWVRWFVAHGRVALHITYNCYVRESDREREVVERIVATLKCPLS